MNEKKAVLEPLLPEERARMDQVLDKAPSEYRIFLDQSAWSLGPEYTEAHHDFRESIVIAAMKRNLNSGSLGSLLLELSASLLALGMKRETFLKNAEFWYDSVRLASSGDPHGAQHNAPGTEGTLS